MLNFYLMPSKGSYSESLKFRTVIFESTNGVTNTRQMITYPKHLVKYSSVAFYTNRHMRIINGFRDGLTFKVIHPLWGRGALITSSNSGTTIYCDTSNSNFAVDDTVFLEKSYDEYVEAIILEVWPSHLIMTTPVDTLQGKLVLPTFFGILTGSIDTSYTGENYALCTINIEELV